MPYFTRKGKRANFTLFHSEHQGRLLYTLTYFCGGIVRLPLLPILGRGLLLKHVELVVGGVQLT